MPYNSLDLAHNPIRITIPFPANYPAPEKLRYLAELYVPDAPGSANFVKLADMEAAHRPKQNGTYQDAELYVEDYLRRQFRNPVPDGLETTPAQRLVRIPGAVLPYYLRYQRVPLESSFSQMPTRYALAAGLGSEDFAGNVFITEVLQVTKMFLTWQPAEKLIQPEQPEYLYFLTNFPGLTSLSLKVKYGTNTVETKATAGGVQVNSIYRCAVGYTQLALPAGVKSYEVWLENQSGIAVSEIRTYKIDTRHRRNVKYILFQNGLGGFDTLCFTGRSQRTLSTKSESVQRFLPQHYTISDGEFEVTEVSGENTLEVSTGYISRKYYSYLQDLFLSEQIFLLSQKGPVPYSLQSKDLLYDVDDETLFGAKIRLKANYAVNKYSNVPVVTFTATQSYTATCPALQVGPPVTRSATATSTLSTADAQAKALAMAQALAEAALVCTFAPAGQFIRTQCKPNTTELWSIVTNGTGGEIYGALLDAQSTQCGFIANLNFTIRTTEVGVATLDDFVGGNPALPYEVSFNNGRTWTPLPNAGGLNNPQAVSIPVGGLISITVRRGDRTFSRDVLMPNGTTGTSPAITLVSNYNRPDIGPTKTAIGVRTSNNTILYDPIWMRYQLTRRIDNNPFNNVLVKDTWMNMSDIITAALNPTDQSPTIVTLPVLSSGTVYEVIFLAGPTGWGLNSIQFTIP